MIHDKNILDITESDLQALIDNEEVESKNLEYKEILPDLKDLNNKSELLADISSFANANGGDIIYGIKEEKSKPISLVGCLELKDIDNIKSQIQNILNSNLRPRILGLNIKEVKLKDSKFALVIRIPKSWNSPHRIVLASKNFNKFFTRGTNGKYEPDIDELRLAFTLSESLSIKIKNFLEKRIYKIDSNETPIILLNNPKIVFHIIPLNAFDPTIRYDLSKIINDPNLFTPTSSQEINFGSPRYNIDGVLKYNSFINYGNFSYTQIYKNGIIEVVDAFIIQNLREKIVNHKNLEGEILKAYSGYKKSMKILNIDFPIIFKMTFLGVKGFSIFNENSYLYKFLNKDNPLVVDRDNLFFSDILIENTEEKSSISLKPLFDSIWNAFGYEKSKSYDANGNWINEDYIYLSED